MKVSLTYPKIPDTTGCMLKKCWVFEKLDGTNMHFDFRGSEFISFGTRRDSFTWNEEGFAQFAAAHPEIAQAPRKLDQDMEEFLFTWHSGMTGTLFTEYLGPKSFAGQHVPGDDMRHVVIDFMKGKKFYTPEQFLDMFGAGNKHWPPNRFEHAKLLYQGKYSGQLVEDIRNGKFPVAEGAIIKGVYKKDFYMAKVKTNAYMERLKTEFKDSWKDYWE